MKRFLLLFAVLAGLDPGFIGAAQAATSPSFTASDVTVLETTGSAQVVIRKSVKEHSYSKIQLQTVDGTAKAGVDYQAVSTVLTFGNSTLSESVPIQIIARAGYQGDRSFTAKLTCVRYCALGTSAITVTIGETEQPSSTWVAAPLQGGGYARIVKAEPSPWTPVGYTPAVGSVWYVVPKGGGWTADDRAVVGLQPIDQVGVAFTAFEAYREDVEGVARSLSALKAAPLATATKTCQSVGQTGDSRSAVLAGRRYRLHAAGHGLVSADDPAHPGLGAALVPRSCLAP